MGVEAEGTGEAGDEVLGEGEEQDVVVEVSVVAENTAEVEVRIEEDVVVEVAVTVKNTAGVEVRMEEDAAETLGEGEVLDGPKAAVETTAAAGEDKEESAGADWVRGVSSASCAGASGGGESAM